MKRMTVAEAVDYALTHGKSDILVDACGLWQKQDQRTKNRYVFKYVWCLDLDYDEHIAYVELENSRNSTFR